MASDRPTNTSSQGREEPPVALTLRNEAVPAEPGSWVNEKVDEARLVAAAAVVAAAATELEAQDPSVRDGVRAVSLPDVSRRLVTVDVQVGSVEVAVEVPRAAVDVIAHGLEAGFLGAAGGAGFHLAGSAVRVLWNAVAQRLRRGDVPIDTVEDVLPEDIDEWEVRFPTGKRERVKGRKKGRAAPPRRLTGRRVVATPEEPPSVKRKRPRKRGRTR